MILTGDRGVGRTVLVRRLALAVISGRFPHLAGRPMLRIDVSNVGPEDSRACLEALITTLALVHDCVICLDGFAALFPRTNGGSNKPLLRTLLSRLSLRIIGIMTDWEYSELIGGDAQTLPLISRVRLAEPLEEEAREIALNTAYQYESQFNLSISREVVGRAVTLASTFLLNQRHPSKSLNVLWQACENRAYATLGLNQSRPCLTEDDLVTAVAELTSLPCETISGQGANCDFSSALRQSVVGQEIVVREVATELRLITSGLTEPNKPASVMMFAGMTGVGKTELAKRIAELYSSSRRVNVYSMGSFTESHSVSGLVGVPPGYVGHEQGGRLINDLNADPYAVFLLDEAEKCHPNVWKPFLHLFDEGWITDLRGVKAFADRAIFILTTNVGDRQIGQLITAGKSQAELAEQIRKTLAKVRHERSSQVLFPPPFLARIKRILVFQPLDAEAMRGITDRVSQQLCQLWKRRTSKEMIITSSALQFVADRAQALNQRSDGQEGGRIVRKLFTDLVESVIQEYAAEQMLQFRNCQQIRVDREGSDMGDRELLISFLQ
ncbi:MAG: AAA family ATPase [Planctomycetota bacterium]